MLPSIDQAAAFPKQNVTGNSRATARNRFSRVVLPEEKGRTPRRTSGPSSVARIALLLFQAAGYRVEGGGKACTDRRHARDDHDRDQGRDQAIFDGGGAGLIFQECFELDSHVRSLVEVASKVRQAC